MSGHSEPLRSTGTEGRDLVLYGQHLADIVMSREAVRRKSTAPAMITSITFIIIPASFLTYLLSSYVDSTISGARKVAASSGSAKTTNVGVSGNGSTTQTRTGGTTKGNSISPGDTTQGDTTMGNDDNDEKGSAITTIKVDAEGKV